MRLIGPIALHSFILQNSGMVRIIADIIKAKGIEGGALLAFLAPLTGQRNGAVPIIKEKSASGLQNYENGSLDGLINLQRVNDIMGINAFFKAGNAKLKEGASMIACMENLEQRRDRLFKKFPWGVNLLYYMLDFVYKRIFPKFRLTKRIYFALTQGRNRALSKSEILGRLVYCGFEIEEVQEINKLMYFKAVKRRAPLEEPEPSSGILLRVKRIGHRGKSITVYKFRTMHPYAQYIQDYVFAQNDLAEGGKFRDDFRITKWGRWMRRFWIDEIPMIWNILRGDLKLVGVRPLSEHYLSLYSSEIKAIRVQGKPGLIPPFYADMPKNLDEIQASEHRYMQAYIESPYTTDLQYCLRAFQNIVLKKARSN